MNEEILIPRKNTRIEFAPMELLALYRLVTAFLDEVKLNDPSLGSMVPVVGDVETKIFARLTLVSR
jgi:hypothetical protein